MRVEIALLLVGMAAVTFLPRFVPLALISRLSLNPRLKESLGYMPVAILSAILFPALFSTADSSFILQPRLLLAALPVIVLMYFFKNLWLAVTTGMLAYWLAGIF